MNKILALVAGALLGILALAVPAQASIGGRFCSPPGATRVDGGKTYRCVQSGDQSRWVVQSAPSSAAPSSAVPSSASPSASRSSVTPTSVQPSTLPTTGSGAAGVAAVGGALLMAGGVALGVSQRRRRRFMA
jgi:LPXTG-motif cell wall-anchored protein